MNAGGSVVSTEQLEALERLATACNGDVPTLIAEARRLDASFANDTLLAVAVEHAAARRGASGDRVSTWWLSCAAATLRDAGVMAPQEAAELCAARCLGELARSSTGHAPLPLAAQWLVAGEAMPSPTQHTLELAHRNSLTHLERLDAELVGRAPLLESALGKTPNASLRQAVEAALDSYAHAVRATRAALSRVADHVVARGGDATLGGIARAAIIELDDTAAGTLVSRVESLRRSLGLAAEARLASRAAFAAVDTPASLPSDDVASLDAAMRSAYEHAWATPSAVTRANFEHAVRARYAIDVANIEDPTMREEALAHYVAHAMSQIPSD